MATYDSSHITVVVAKAIVNALGTLSALAVVVCADTSLVVLGFIKRLRGMES
tara:strand:+ start:146 stop:301 length:156 start_codon:yes stop_codon:yes gene_type:complete